MKKILGLDLGVASIGWALVNEAETKEEKSSIIKLGVRVNPLDNKTESSCFVQGKSIATNTARREKRCMRRNLQRYKLRRDNLIECLRENNIITEQTVLHEAGKNSTFETYGIRAKAAREEVSLEELGRVLLMINKKRGYRSSRKAKSADEGQLIDGMAVAKQLYEENITPGELLLSLYRKGNKYVPAFYRSDLENELDRIWDFQKTFYADVLTDEVKEKLQGKSSKKTSEMFFAIYKLNGAEIKGKDKKLESYHRRVDALSKQLPIEEVIAVISELNGAVNNASGYLGAISDRSKELYFNNQTVGEYLMSELDKNPNFSLKNKVFYRTDYLNEFEQIWSTQAKYHKELTEALKQEIRDIIIFYQRPLKSQKGQVSYCELESKTFEIEQDGKLCKRTIGPKVCPKSSPLFQEFRMWQTINNLEVEDITTGETYKLELNDKKRLFDKLQFKEEMKKKDVLKFLYGKSVNYDLNYESIEGNHTLFGLYKAFLNIVAMTGHEINYSKASFSEVYEAVYSIFKSLGFNTDYLYYDSSLKGKDYENQPFYRLWHLLYSYEGDKSCMGLEGLTNKISEMFGFGTEYASELAKVNFEPDYGSLSARALHKLLPYMREGYKYSEACEEVGFRHSKDSLTREEIENKVLKDHLEQLPRNSLRNPVVEKILNQMINVVNEIIDTYGRPDEIRLEMARELKKNAKERQELTSAINNANKKNEEYRKFLHEEIGIEHVTHNDIIRYKLYLELESNGFRTLYSNQYISSPNDLFSGNIEIEHIIPKAKLFDDSYSNKTLEFNSINKEKDNKTAYDYVLSKYGEDGADKYKTRVNMLRKAGAISKSKHDKLLMTLKDIPNDFIERDLRETQYIARKAREILEEVVTTVLTTTGTITDKLRNDWQLVDVMQELNMEKYSRIDQVEEWEDKSGKKVRRIKNWTKRNDHRHHAMDALTIAFTNRRIIQHLNTLSSRNGDNPEIIYKQRFISPIPIKKFRAEAIKQLNSLLISIKAKNKVVTKNVNRIKTSEGDKMKIELTPRGKLHDDTFYGLHKQREGKGGKSVTNEMFYTTRKKITENFKINDIKNVVDPVVRKILMDRLSEYGNNSKEAFSNLDAKPIYRNKERKIVIKSVLLRTNYKNLVGLHQKRDIEGNLILDEDGKIQYTDFVNTDGNHHAVIFRDSAGKLQEHVVTFYQASMTAVGNGNVIDKNYNKDLGWKFLFTMKRNEYFVFPNVSTGFDPNKIDLMNPKNYDVISKNLFRVRSISSNDYEFQHHLETTVDKNNKKLKEITLKRITSISNLEGIVKVRINHLGQIVHVGEY